MVSGSLTPISGAEPQSEPVVEVPGKPDGLEVTAEPGSLKVALDWDDTEGADSYLVRWRLFGPGNELNEGITVTSSEATIDVDAAAEWVVRIKACNGAGCGPHLAQQFTVEAAPEAEPEDDVESDDDDQAGLEDDGESDGEADDEVGPQQGTGPGTPRAESQSQPVVEVPGKPDGLEVSAEPGSLEVALDWDDTEGADSYLVRWRLFGPGNELNEGITVTSSEATIDVASAAEWVVRIEACNGPAAGRTWRSGSPWRRPPKQSRRMTPSPTTRMRPGLRMTPSPTTRMRPGLRMTPSPTTTRWAPRST